MGQSKRIWQKRIEDWDRPLHRILPVWRFEEALRLKQLTLVKPSLWSDPAEDPLAKFMLDSMSLENHPRQQQLADYLSQAWAMCWSHEGESDVLLRAYSRVVHEKISSRNTCPAEEGVRVTTTPRRLLRAMGEWSDRYPERDFFIGAVDYRSANEMRQSLADRLAGPEGPRYFSKPQGRADSLSVKRTLFRHEEEVRVICVGEGKLAEGDDLLHLPVEPSDLFTEVKFDPRLAGFERKERMEAVKALGYDGEIVEDDSYINVFNLVFLKKGWLPPE